MSIKNTMSINLVKKLMKLYPSSSQLDDYSLWEVFRHDHYVLGSREEQNTIKHASSKCAYDYETKINLF